MSSIGGLSSSTSNSISSIRGYGGLASGLDRDSLIEGMTAGTRAKIAKQLQKKQTYQWQQDALRGISSKLVEFSRKYMSYTNPSTNLSSASFFARNSITARGSNSKYLDVSGSSSIVDSLSILGVKQLAKNTSMSSKDVVSDGTLNTGGVEVFASDGTNITEAKESISNLEGGYVSIKYGNKTFGVSLGSGTTTDGFTYDYSTAEKAQESFTKALKGVAIGEGKTLADVLKVEASPVSDTDPKLGKLNIKSTDTAGNTIMVVGGSTNALNALGITNNAALIDYVSDEKKTITADGINSDCLDAQVLFREETFQQRIAGKGITFNYNGATGKVKFDEEKIKEYVENAKNNTSLTTPEAKNKKVMEDIAADMKDQLDRQFGYDRIQVGVTADSDGKFKLDFTTTDPSRTGDVNGFARDTSSVLSLASSDSGILGETGAFHVEYGESNRLNLGSKLIDSGLNLPTGNSDYNAKKDLDTTYFAGALKASELIEKLGSKVTSSTTVEEMKQLIKENNPSISDKDYSSVCEALDKVAVDAGNNSVAGANIKAKLDTYVSEREIDLQINGTQIKGITYQSTLNDIISKINSSEAGVTISYMKNADKFSIQANAGGAGGQIKLEGEGAKFLFGENGDDYTISQGQDAIVSVKYAGSDEVVELKRGNNAFNLDGLNVTLKGTFGYEDFDTVFGKLKGVSDSDTISVLQSKISGSSDLTSDEKKYLVDSIAMSGLANDKTVENFKATMTALSDYDNIVGRINGLSDTSTIGDLKAKLDDSSLTALSDSEKEALKQIITESGLADSAAISDLDEKVQGIQDKKLHYQDKSSEAVTFDAKVDADKIVKAVTDMINDLNEAIKLVNDEVSTKPNRDYEPLTDEQKAELSEDQIEKWEEKAKAGLLFADSDIRGLSDSLRFIMDSGSDERNLLASFGISTGTDYGDNGKLVFDETKFRAALESNPDKVQELFTKKANADTGEKGGFMARLNSVTEKYASTTGATKGILIERGGSVYAPTSILNNYLQKSIDGVDSYVERLQDKLETETDRYIRQFTSLETLISQMNSQSSWMSQQFGM